MRWTKNDEKRVRRVLYDIAADTSQAEFARSLGAKSRATVNNWIRRGKIPVDNIPGVLARAKALGMKVVAADLHPDARTMAQMEQRGAA